MEKKLFRNEHDKMIAGIASGLADYLQVEVTIIRLLFVLSTIFMAGAGLIAYIIIWIIVPVNHDPATRFTKFNDYFNSNNQNASPFGSGSTQTNWSQPVNERTGKTPFETQPDFKFNKANDTGRTVGGLFLLVIGCFFLMRELDLIPDWFRLRNFWPLIFIVLGISIIAKARRKNDWKAWENQQTPEATKSENLTDANVAEKPDITNTAIDLNKNNPQV